MNKELIARLDIEITSDHAPKWLVDLFVRCKAEIQRLESLLTIQGKLNIALYERLDELESELAKAKEYVPMKDSDCYKLIENWTQIGGGTYGLIDSVEAEVIKRAGLIIKEKE